MSNGDHSTQPPGAPNPLTKAMRAVVNEINDTKAKRPPQENAPPEFRFIEISERLTEALLESANAQMVRAESNLKRAQTMADDIKNRTKEMWEILQGFERELEDYSTSTLETHRKFTRTKQ